MLRTADAASDVEETRAFDVFLSHNSREKPAVERIAERLKREAIEPWLDKWCLTPGGDWQDELAEGLRRSVSCAVFVGPGGIGDWERMEFKLATDRMAKDRNFRVFLVLLPDLPEPFDTSSLPPFLSTRTWVDMRKGVADPRAFQTLINAVKGVAPGPETPIARRDDVCPYRGLRAFDEEHSEFFFGREGDVQRLVEKLKSTRFLAVLGPSGSGKSSVVRAGLIPALRKGALTGSDTWAVRVFTPGARPLTQLAANLVRLYPQSSAVKTLDELSADERALHLASSVALAERPESERVVWVIDQFEEVFTLCRDEAERSKFISNLLYAAGVPGGRSAVVLTMRADFYQKCAAYPELSAQVAAQQFLISPMSTEGLRQAITEPAWRVGLEFEQGLAETILDDVESQPGALPLLEHALLELWERRRGRLLTLEAYRETGGVEGAIAKRADAVFESFDPERQSIARRVMLRLTQPGEGTEDTRRRATLGELITRPDEAGKVRDVVTALADARLLMTDSGAGEGSEAVDVSHEALIRSWPRLRRWVEEDRQGLRTHRRLTEAAQEWQRSNRDEGLLFRGARLAQTSEWRERNQSALNEFERGFLDASTELQTRERLAAQRRTRRVVAGLVVALILISAATVYAFYQSRVATRRGTEALARELAANASAQLPVNPELGLLLAVEAARTAHTTETENTLRQALVRTPRHVLRMSGQDEVSFSPDGKYVLTTGDKKAQVWDAATGGGVLELGHDQEVFDAEFSPDGKTITTTSGGTLQLWDAGDGRSVSKRQVEDYVGDVTFSSDDGLLFTDGASLRIWEAGGQQPLAELDVHEPSFSRDGNTILGWVSGGKIKVYTRDGAGWRLSAELETTHHRATNTLIRALSPDGRLVAVGTAGGVNVYEQGGKRLLRKLQLSGEASVVAFNPDGKLLAAAANGEARVWETSKWYVEGRAGGHQSTVDGISFSPDGGLLLTRDTNRSARLHSRRSGRFLAEFGVSAGGGVLDAGFSPDGKLLFTKNLDGSVWLWDLNVWRSAVALKFVTLGTFFVDGVSNNGVYSYDHNFFVTAQDYSSGYSATNVAFVKEPTNQGYRTVLELPHPQKVRGVSISPDGKRVLTTSDDNTARVWGLDGGGRILFELKHVAPLSGAAFSPDGQLILSVSGRAAWVWDANDGHLVENFKDEGVGVGFSPDDRFVMVSVADGAQLWDLSRKRVLLEWREGAQGGQKPKPLLGSSTDGKLSLVAEEASGAASSFQVKDPASGRTVVELRGHVDEITSGAFSPDGKFVVTTSMFMGRGSGGTPDNANEVRVWDVSSGSTFYEFREYNWPVLSGAFSPDGKYVIAGVKYGTDAFVYIYACELCVSHEGLLDMARRRSVRQLTPDERARYLHEAQP